MRILTVFVCLALLLTQVGIHVLWERLQDTGVRLVSAFVLSVFPLGAQPVLLQNLLVLQNMDRHLDLLVLPDKKCSEDSLDTFSLLR